MSFKTVSERFSQMGADERQNPKGPQNEGEGAVYNCDSSSFEPERR